MVNFKVLHWNQTAPSIFIYVTQIYIRFQSKTVPEMGEPGVHLRIEIFLFIVCL